MEKFKIIDFSSLAVVLVGKKVSFAAEWLLLGASSPAQTEARRVFFHPRLAMRSERKSFLLPLGVGRLFRFYLISSNYEPFRSKSEPDALTSRASNARISILKSFNALQHNY